MDEEFVLIENIETIEDAQDGLNSETLEADTWIAEFDGELDNDSPMEETTLDVLDVEGVQEIEIEVNEAIGWVSGDSSRHYSLYGRDEANQHPISAITGLEEKLGRIEALKPVESNGINVANYYKWDGNKAYGEHGYFVSLALGSSEIKICEGSDIFGVSVDAAGFMGGQDEATPRNNSYGLVVTSGIVDVRCELDVEVGDYVTSNAQGYAKKSDSNYGYRVLAKETKNGTEYAAIMLGVQADVTNLLGTELIGIDIRLDAAEENIVSAINVANQAYNKASNAASSASASKEDVEEALREILGFGETIDDMEKAVASSSVVAAQAKAIAESAATSAESMKNEAIEKANEALGEVSKIRGEFDESINQIKGDLDDNVEYINETKESLENLARDLEPLSKWESKDGTQSGYSGFVAQSDENATELGFVSGYEYKDVNGNIVSKGLAGLISQVEKNKSEIALITSFDQDEVEGMAALVERVSDHDAQLQTLTSWKTEQVEVVSNISQKTNQNSSDIEIVSSWKNTVENDVSSIANIRTTANENKAAVEQLVEKDTGLGQAIAGVKVIAADNAASIDNLTSWQGETNNALALIEQKADANGAYIQSTVANIDKYSVGPYSQAYGFDLDQAESVIEEGTIYVPTVLHTEEYRYTDASNVLQTYKRSFVPQYLYKWGLVGERYGWITVDKNYSETDESNTSSKAVYFTTEKPSVSGNFGYWYTNGDDVAEGHESYTLYKYSTYTTKDDEGASTTEYIWVPVATLSGNSQSRAVSQIRQDANSIEFDVTNIKGDLAGIKIWAGNNFVAIKDTVSWKDTNSEAIAKTIQKATDSEAYIAQIASVKNDDGTVNAAASIVTAVNKSDSSVFIEADHINLNGYVTVTDLSDEGKTTINGANIATGTIDAKRITSDFVSALNLEVGNQVTMGPNATISWNQVDGAEDEVTRISQDEISTATINADQVDVGGDLNAFGANIGGWSITEDSIEFSNGTTSIGLQSGTESYDSLTASEETSPIRLKCNGALVEKSMILYTYNMADGEFTEEFEIEEDVREIRNCICLMPNCTVLSCELIGGKIVITADSTFRGDTEFEVTYATPGGFMLLEDGSIYAEAARIEGEIVATKGSFTGEINAVSGRIGGLTIGDEEIWSSSGGLTFSQNGLITADKLHLKNYFETKDVHAQKISGRNNSPAYLLLESEGTENEYVAITVNSNEITKGKTNFWGDITSKGQVNIIVTAGKKLTIEQIVKVNLTYYNKIENDYERTQCTVVMPAGQTTASISVSQLTEFYSGGRKRKFEFSSCSIPQSTITQPKTVSTSAIASSVNFVPLVTQQQSLGASDKVWNYIYRLNESDGSDRKIKDNISDIDGDFSKQLIDGLSPKSYIFKTAKTPRTHYGFIAQEVEELLHSLGTSADEVGIVCKSLPGEPDGENNYYGLNYTNLIAPMVSVIQQLSRRVEELENKLNTKQND